MKLFPAGKRILKLRKYNKWTIKNKNSLNLLSKTKR